MSTLTVAGIGSRHSADDAIGLRLVESLPPDPGLRRELWEDADALGLAHRLLECEDPVLIVDCADLGLAGGEWRCLSLDGRSGARLIPRSRSISTHGLGLAEALDIARDLGMDAPVHVFGVQPFELRCGLAALGELSEPMRERLPALRAALREHIATLTVQEA